MAATPGLILTGVFPSILLLMMLPEAYLFIMPDSLASSNL
jgi:hypothetical protein